VQIFIRTLIDRDLTPEFRMAGIKKRALQLRYTREAKAAKRAGLDPSLAALN